MENLWYDKIAKFYDFFTALLYKKARLKLINDLNIKKGDRVLVVACGTGQSFKFIHDKTGDNGEIIAFDYSQEMLNVARKRIAKNKWKNIILLNADARDIDKRYFENAGINTDFDIVIAELAFTVIPEWKKVMNVMNSLMKENGKIGILDWYREKNDWLTKIVDFLAKAETNRNIIEYASKLFDDFTVTGTFLFGNVFTATGKKKPKS